MSYVEKVKEVQNDKRTNLKQRKEISKAIVYLLKENARDLNDLNSDVHEYLNRNKGMFLPRVNTQELFYQVIRKMLDRTQIVRHLNKIMITYSGEKLCYLYSIADQLREVKYENSMTFNKLWEHLRTQPTYEDMESFFFQYDETYIRKVLHILMSAGYLNILNSTYILEKEFVDIFEI